MNFIDHVLELELVVKISLFYIKHIIRRNLPELYKIHECKMITKTERDERYSGKFVHCFLDGKTHSYKIHRHLYALMKKIPLFFGYPDGKTGYYQYDVMLKKFVKSKNPTYIFNVSKNNFKDIYVTSDFLKINMIITNEYRICGLLKESDALCSRKPKWPQSCNIMFTNAIELFSLILGIMIILCNSLVFISGFFIRAREILNQGIDRKHILSSFRLSTLCLHGNDLLFGIYLLTIFIAGKYHNENNVMQVKEWLKSQLCTFLGIMTSFVMLNSLFLLILISVSRFVAVKYPLNRHFKQLNIIMTYLFCGFLGTTVLCLGVYFFYYAMEGKNEMPSSTCLFVAETLNSKTIKCFNILCLLTVWLLYFYQYNILSFD